MISRETTHYYDDSNIDTTRDLDMTADYSTFQELFNGMLGTEGIYNLISSTNINFKVESSDRV